MEQKIRVLLVDDEPDFLEPISFWLHSKGYYVLIASNGKKAIEIIKEKNPHIVFMDIKMPEMDGIEALKRIREFNQVLPVVMFTAFPDMGKFLIRFPQAKDLKISGFFPKEGSLQEFESKIEVTLRTHKNLKDKS